MLSIAVMSLVSICAWRKMGAFTCLRSIRCLAPPRSLRSHHRGRRRHLLRRPHCRDYGRRAQRGSVRSAAMREAELDTRSRPAARAESARAERGRRPEEVQVRRPPVVTPAVQAPIAAPAAEQASVVTPLLAQPIAQAISLPAANLPSRRPPAARNSRQFPQLDEVVADDLAAIDDTDKKVVRFNARPRRSRAGARAGNAN